MGSPEKSKPAQQEGRTAQTIQELLPNQVFSMNPNGVNGTGREALRLNDQQLYELRGLNPQEAISYFNFSNNK